MLLAALLALPFLPQSPAERIDAYLEQEMETWRVPGASVAVVRDGAVVFEKGYGLANVELGVPADEHTVYELLSVSKQFTATAVMLLVDEKKLSLDDRIAARLDGLPDTWKDVTVSQLLSHTSGIPDYTDQRGWLETIRAARTPRELLATVESQPLLFPPGTAWKYSNSNYYLLGLLIEKIGGERFDKFLGERLFDPLGMRATRIESFEAILPHRAAGYHASKEAVSNSPWIDPSHKWAAGAFVSSIDDMTKWAAALDGKKLLQPASLERMLAPAVLLDGTKTTYGFANELDLDHGHRVAGHQGGGMAFNATLLRYVDDRLSVIVLCNLTQGPSRVWARHVASFWIADLAESAPAIADAHPEFTVIFRRLLVEAAQGHVDADVFAADVRAKMKAFIEHAGPQFLAPRGKLESLTPVESAEHDGSSKLRYRSTFEKSTLTWTVELDGSGKIESLEPEE